MDKMIQIRIAGKVESYSTRHYTLVNGKLVRNCDGKVIREEL